MDLGKLRGALDGDELGSATDNVKDLAASIDTIADARGFLHS